MIEDRLEILETQTADLEKQCDEWKDKYEAIWERIEKHKS